MPAPVPVTEPDEDDADDEEAAAAADDDDDVEEEEEEDDEEEDLPSSSSLSLRFLLATAACLPLSDGRARFLPGIVLKRGFKSLSYEL